MPLFANNPNWEPRTVALLGGQREVTGSSAAKSQMTEVPKQEKPAMVLDALNSIQLSSALVMGTFLLVLIVTSSPK